MTEELRAKKYLLLRMPIPEIERIRADYENARLQKQIFGLSKYALAGAGMVELPPTLGLVPLNEDSVKCRGNWNSINKDLLNLLGIAHHL
ncbi:MAG: hypothetical protein QM715_00500 [Nibricoccus sp.]